MKYKQVKFRLSSWNKLRKQFYGRQDENFSDYIERIAEHLKDPTNSRQIPKGLVFTDEQARKLKQKLLYINPHGKVGVGKS